MAMVDLPGQIQVTRSVLDQSVQNLDHWSNGSDMIRFSFSALPWYCRVHGLQPSFLKELSWCHQAWFGPIVFNSPYDNSTASCLIDWKPVPPVLGELEFYLVIPGANHDFAHRFALATWPWLRKGCTRNLGFPTGLQHWSATNGVPAMSLLDLLDPQVCRFFCGVANSGKET